MDAIVENLTLPQPHFEVAWTTIKVDSGVKERLGACPSNANF